MGAVTGCTIPTRGVVSTLIPSLTLLGGGRGTDTDVRGVLEGGVGTVM